MNNPLDMYNSVFREIFKVTDECLNEKFTFSDVEAWDSVTHMILISALEDAFDIMFDTEDILNFGSYENGKCLLEKYDVRICE